MYLINFILAGMFVASFGFLDSMYLNRNCSKPDSFVCRDSRCISNSQRCDGTNDCFDGSDEEDCDPFLCKAPNYFRCKNQVCVSSSFVCDGENDCGDFSDEVDCDSFKLISSHPSNCSTGEWQCNDKFCIPEEFVCNGDLDCLDGSDEVLGCSKTTKCDGFQCRNNYCIPHQWRCDGSNDCQDNSDELNCDSYIDPKKCSLDDRLFLCHNNHSCIALSKVCDHKADCPDSSDEGGLCSGNEISCRVHRCSHDCATLPEGPKCFCPKGYHIINDKDCIDINECEKYGICDQKCRNTPGSYECLCDSNYVLQEDKTTCKAVTGEAMMVFSSKTEIRGYFLKSKLYFPIAKDLKHVVGVGFDGNHIYWTDIHSEHEAIVKALEDGSQREFIVTSGLDTPEDLAVDWITGNIYFTDSEMHHIGVCTNDGNHCTVLINKDISKPRGIVLNPSVGEMYWSDWGHPAKIGRSRMDGTDDMAFVSNNIAWPNGLALDYPNERLYWADAKSARLESIRLDGTDRRVVMEGIVKHPYAIAIFENSLYWSDWHTRSIESCDKFTGKNHHTLIKDKLEYIYGIHIYHSSLKEQTKNPCTSAPCSDICLLNGNGYTCACPENKILSSDSHSCKATAKEEVLMLGTKDLLIRIEHQLLGKHKTNVFPTLVKDIGSLAYSSSNNTLFISDLSVPSLLALSLTTGTMNTLVAQEQFDALAFDYLGNNLYWCNSIKATVEVLNLNTMSRKILLHDIAGEIPTSITVASDQGVMFISFKKKFNQGYHIDRFNLDGTGRTHIIDEGLLGPLTLYYEFQLQRVFWADAGTGNIESTSIYGNDSRRGFRSLQTIPVALASLSENLFWTNQNSRMLFWADKHNNGNGLNKKITLELPSDTSVMHIVSVTPRPVPPHPCHQNNGKCSHLCFPTEKSAHCACPLGMSLSTDDVTCFKPKTCTITEFFCGESNVCVPKEMVCNGRKDCEFGEDEHDCTKKDRCAEGEFQCKDGKCLKRISNSQRCDGTNDCFDGSDEEDCDAFLCKAPNYFRCKNQVCVSSAFVCDGENDCGDFSDEVDCVSFKLISSHLSNCSTGEWQCIDRFCIPEEFVCNGDLDCLDGSDEVLGCSKTTKCDGFQCHNNYCIPHQWRCDDSNDCQDNSDELNCDSYIDPKKCALDDRLFLCHNNHSCIALSKVCDHKADCPDSSDEGGLCSGNEISCRVHRCSHDCAALPEGPKCLCPKGYHIINDKDCIDINECEKYGICDQKCRNTPGSYECLCDSNYVLQEDKTTCKAVTGEAMMVFSSKTEIRGYFLKSKLYFPIAKDLKHVVGVGFDGKHIYWTDIYSEHEAIVKALEDGSQREFIVTSGLGAPEDLAVDWITGNIYFTDSEMHHIGVCTNDGNHCTVLINKDISKPRGIVLNPSVGEMYWSDWGRPAKIGRSRMDGTDDMAFVSNVAWPNGLALDYSNERLYWADAKNLRLESIRLDGTDRRVLMEGIVKHPYAIAIFENRLYWSDWHTRSIESCDKFTGKNHHTLIKGKLEDIYGIHIYHSSLKEQTKNPCTSSLCSDICLLNGNGYTCACPENKILSSDSHSCKATAKEEVLMLGTKDLLIRIEHQLLGKHKTNVFPTLVKDIGSLAYSSSNNTLFISDLSVPSLLALSLTTGTMNTLVAQEQFDALAFDYLGNNLYWCNYIKATVEVLNLNTMSRKILLHDIAGEIPTSITVASDKSVMFISFKKKFNQGYHIDRFNLDGTGRTHIIDEGLLGPLTLYYEFQLQRVFWADAGTGNIESTSIYGNDSRRGFRSLQTIPVALASLSENLFWTNQNSRMLFWADKQNNGNGLNKKIILDIPSDVSVMHMVSVTPRPTPQHPCHQNNGKCSHLCFPTENSAHCACPLGMSLSTDDVTCFEQETCTITEFFCGESNVCVPKEMVCNGRKDCEFGEDEHDCNSVEKSALVDRRSGSIVAGVLIPVFLLLGAVAAYIFIRKRNTGKLNISMRFYNPMFELPVINNNSESLTPMLHPGEHEYTNLNDSDSQDMQTIWTRPLRSQPPGKNILIIKGQSRNDKCDG